LGPMVGRAGDLTDRETWEGVNTHMWNDLKSYLRGLTAALVRNEEGQGLVEYALILSIVSIGCLVALGALTTALNGVLTTISGAL
jgi:Flp pilus assembly pilin Flp